MPPQLPGGTNLSSPQIKLITNWDEGFKEMNVDIIGKHLQKEFRLLVYPRTIGQPEQTKEEFLKKLSGGFAFATGFDVGHTTCYSTCFPPAISAL